MSYEISVGIEFADHLGDYFAWYMYHHGEDALPQAQQLYRDGVRHIAHEPHLQPRVLIDGLAPREIRRLLVWRFRLFYEVDEEERRIYLLSFLHERASDAAVARALR